MKTRMATATTGGSRGRFALAVGLAALLLLAGVGDAIPVAWAEDSPGKGARPSGRIYNPSRLRTRAEGASKGRSMQRPPIPDPESRALLRPQADIPNPEPRSRGGAGLVRRGKSFYEVPQPPTLARRTGVSRRATIPNPEVHIPKQSAATR